MKHFLDASPKSAIMQQIFDGIASIPADERFHVEYTARFLESELKKRPNEYDGLVDQLVESMEHAGREMCTHMEQHKKNIDNEGGLKTLTPVFSF